MLIRSALRAKGSNSGDGCRITEFNMARSDDAAECQQLQGSSFLLRALFAHLHVMNQGKEDVHCIFLLEMKMRDDFSHPEHLTEVLIEGARALALHATGEEFACLCLCVPAKHERILVTFAEGTGLAVQCPTNGPDLSDLFVHRSPLPQYEAMG
jgi:hypothetical protein